jgi:hypothetical protein
VVQATEAPVGTSNTAGDCENPDKHIPFTVGRWTYIQLLLNHSSGRHLCLSYLYKARGGTEARELHVPLLACWSLLLSGLLSTCMAAGLGSWAAVERTNVLPNCTGSTSMALTTTAPSDDFTLLQTC